MSGNFTGPVVVVPFVGQSGTTEFAMTFHVGVDDDVQVAKIVDRMAEDGYKPYLKGVKRYFMVNGSLEPREPVEERKSGPIGFQMRSAHLRG